MKIVTFGQIDNGTHILAKSGFNGVWGHKWRLRYDSNSQYTSEYRHVQKICRECFEKNRSNGEIQYVSGARSIPGDGTYKWVTGREEKNWVCGEAMPASHYFAYALRYNAGSEDLACMEERDQLYLMQAFKEGKLRELEPAIWYLFCYCEEYTNAINIGDWWSKTLTLSNIDAILKEAEVAEQRLKATKVVDDRFIIDELHASISISFDKKAFLTAINQEQSEVITHMLLSKTALDLSSNYLCHLTYQKWKVFGSALRKSNISRLNLSDNQLSTLTEQSWAVFSREARITIVLSNNGFDNITYLKALIKKLKILTSTNLKIELAETNNPVFLKKLAAERLTDMLPIVFLDLSHRELMDDYIEGPLAYLLEHNLASLEEINLSHNNLTLKSLNILLDLFNKQGWKNIKLLDLSNNCIEITSNDQLERMNPQLFRASEVRINLTGNMIISLSHDAALLELLQCLLDRSQLIIKDFLESNFVSLIRIENSEPRRFELTLRTRTGILVNISMNSMDLQNFNKLKNDKSMMTDAETILYLTKKLNQRRLEMDDDLLDHSLTEYPEEAQKTRVGRLMDYHPDSPLCGRLRTHSIFISDSVAEVPSILFSNKKLTLLQGMVYLVANKKTRHTRLIYEWLTDYGQRFIRVAHLTAGKKSSGLSFFSPGQIGISFEGDGPFQIKAKYLNGEHYIIAGLEAEKEKLEQMHINIQGEVKNGVNVKYKWLIATTSPQREDKDIAERRTQNCLKWATDHIKDDLGIALHVSVYEPLAVVKRLRDNPAALLTSESKVIPKK